MLGSEGSSVAKSTDRDTIQYWNNKNVHPEHFKNGNALSWF